MTLQCILTWGLGFVLAFKVYERYLWHIPEPYRGRPCQGRLWRDRYPAASSEDIRQFLATFAEAYSFPTSEKLRLRPTDTLLELEHTYNPPGSLIDGLESAALFRDIEEEYGLDLELAFFDEMTLGDLFGLIQIRKSLGS